MLTRMRLLLALCVTCCAALPLLGTPGCDKSGTSSSSTMTIGVVPKGTTHVFWKSVKAGADRAGKELGAAIKGAGPAGGKENNTQGRINSEMIHPGGKEVVTSAVCDTALTSAKGKAEKEKAVGVVGS